MTELEIISELNAHVERKRELAIVEQSMGLFHLEQWRDGKLIASIPFHNAATNTGKQYLLGAGFNSVTPITTWYLGLIDGTSGTPTVADGDTPASHAGWSEFTYYNESVRQTWVKTFTVLTNQMVSSAPAQFTVSNSVPSNSFVAGGFLQSTSAKGDATGTLWAHGLFASAVPVQATDVFKLNYTTGL